MINKFKFKYQINLFDVIGLSYKFQKTLKLQQNERFKMFSTKPNNIITICIFFLFLLDIHYSMCLHNYGT